MNVSAADTSVCKPQDQSSLLTFGEKSQDMTMTSPTLTQEVSSMSSQLASPTPPAVESLNSEVDTDANGEEEWEDIIGDDALPQSPDAEEVGYVLMH